jgi:hypothetical protein
MKAQLLSTTIEGSTGSLLLSELPGTYLLISDSTFRNNTAVSATVAFVRKEPATIELRNSTFVDNSVSERGALFFIQDLPFQNLSSVNSSLSGNSDTCGTNDVATRPWNIKTPFHELPLAKARDFSISIKIFDFLDQLVCDFSGTAVLEDGRTHLEQDVTRGEATWHLLSVTPKPNTTYFWNVSLGTEEKVDPLIIVFTTSADCGPDYDTKVSKEGREEGWEGRMGRMGRMGGMGGMGGTGGRDEGEEGWHEWEGMNGR